MSRNRQIAIIILIYLSFNVIFVEDVIAPPIGEYSFSAILTSTGSDIQIIYAEINLTITVGIPPISVRLASNIDLQGCFNLANTAGQNSTILLLYTPSYGGTRIPLNQTLFTNSIEGSPLRYENHSLNNLTHPRQLPSEFHDRFPDWVWYHDEIWYSPTNFILVNLTLSPNDSVIFNFSDSIVATFYLADYFVIGYGFSPSQIEHDETSINTRITVIEYFPFNDVIFNPKYSIETTHEGNEYKAKWSTQPPYPGIFPYGDNPGTIQASFSAYLKRYTNHHPPTTPQNSETIPSTTITTPLEPTDIDLSVYMNLVVLTSVVMITAIILVIYYKRKS